MATLLLAAAGSAELAGRIASMKDRDERIDALFQKLAGFRIVFYLFSHGYMIYLRVK